MSISKEKRQELRSLHSEVNDLVDYLEALESELAEIRQAKPNIFEKVLEQARERCNQWMPSKEPSTTTDSGPEKTNDGSLSVAQEKLQAMLDLHSERDRCAKLVICMNADVKDKLEVVGEIMNPTPPEKPEGT